MDLLLGVIVAVIWGLNIVFGKIALQVMPVYSLLFFRFFVLSLILLPFYYKYPYKHFDQLSKILTIAFVFTICHLGTLFGGLKMGLNSSVAILVSQLGVPFLLIISAILFKYKLTLRLCLGIFLAFTGIFILLNNPHVINNIFAFVLIIISAVFWAVYSILIKKCSDFKAMFLVSWTVFISVPLSLAAAVIFEDLSVPLMFDYLQNANIEQIVSIAYVTILPSLIGHGLWIYLISKNHPASVAPLMLLVPFFGILGAKFIGGENITIHIIIGALFIVIGVALDLFYNEKKITVSKQDLE